MDNKGSEMELEKAKNEVLRKIGRNMLLFQQVEYMLKFLITNGTVSGYISEVRENQKQQADVCAKADDGTVGWAIS